MSVMFPQGGGFAQPGISFASVANSNLAGVLNPNIFRFNNPTFTAFPAQPAGNFNMGINGINAGNILPMLFVFGLNNLFTQLNNGNPGILGALGANPNLGANPGGINPFMNQPVGQGPVQRREGSTDVLGQGQNFVIRDNGGDDTYTIGGAFNRVEISGDKDRNTFRIGGMRNNVSVSNIGRDERIILEGNRADWMEVPTTQGRSGSVTYINRNTGTTATLATDGGRSADFVKQRVSFSQQGAGP